MKKCLFVYNPESGKGKIKKNENYIVDRLSSKYEVSVFYTQYRRHLEEIIVQNGADKDLIVVAGGDGTINEAVNGIKTLGKDVALGIIPTGTTNDVAHSIGISKNIKKALDVILNGKPFKHDIFKVDDKYGIYVCCAGLFTESSYGASQSNKKKFGKLAYGFYAIKQMFKTKTLNLKLSYGDQTISGKFSIFLAINSRNVAGLKLNKKADLDDGLLDVVLVKTKKSKIKLVDVLRVVHLFLFGVKKKSTKNVIHLCLNKFSLELENGSLGIDGEKSEKKSFDFEVLQQGITILVP